MNNQINWNQLKQFLQENFIEHDFKTYTATAFAGVDFDKGLEIFRYILELKFSSHDETKLIFDKLKLYAEGQQNKDILEQIVLKYEPFLKKLFKIIQMPFPAEKGLGWGYNRIFDKLSIPASNRTIPTIRDDFFATETLNGVNKPKYPSTSFLNLFTDNNCFGKFLHSSYHLRNSNIHNDPSISNREIPGYIIDCINSYLYFIFKYYAELCAVIPPNALQPVQTLTIKDLISLSGGAYNPNIKNEVKRENILQTIEKKLKDLDVLFIEGEEGIGKTTVLHQFIAKHPNNCFSYFIDGKDSTTYSILAILQALGNQLYFFTKGYELEEQVHIDNYTNEYWLKDYLPRNFYYLTGKKSSQTFYFIIDGFDEISKDRQNEIKEQIFDYLPYDKPNIKLILTGKQTKNILKNNCRYDKFEMILLSKEESEKVFGNGITSEQFSEINRICQNNAGKIVFFRDLIKNPGISIENIIDNLSSDIKGLYQYLWNNKFNSNETSNLILALITFDEEKYNIESISKIWNISEREVITSIQSIPFVRKNTRGTYEFIFDDFASFAETKLKKYKNKIDKKVIDHLVSNLHSVDSLVRLPEMYKKTGDKDGLLKLLNTERWNQLLKDSEKISVVSRVSNVALETIQNENENKYIPTILKYAILKSALKELNLTTVWQNEIATNLVLGEYIGAENLANIAFLKEDRLKMFASIAKAYVEKGSKVPNNITRKIEELYDDIDTSKDFKNIKESAVEIASLLLYSSPKLAFRLIEDLSGSISDNDNAFDWALAQISLSAHSILENLEDVSKEDINTKVYSKIRSPKIKEFANAILYLSENQTAEQIIDKINQLESTSQKMFLIRNWIGNNRKNENVSNVIELGIKLVLNKSDKYVPKSSDYKIFAMPLPYLSDKDKTYELIEKIEQYTASIEANSSTNDLLAIKLFIARALCNFDFEKGEEKLLDIYSEIEKLSDLAIKCTCLAIYANEATRITKTHQERNLDMYLDAAREGIKNNINKILEQTAAHFEIVQGIITNLVRLYPDDAIDICKKLNKSIDRDNAFLEALATYINQSIEKIDITIVDKLLNSIVDLDIQEIAITEVISKLENISDKEKHVLRKFYKYFDQVDTLYNNRVKCLLFIKIVSILEKNEEDFSVIRDNLNKTWNELEKSVYKIELGFEIAYSAAFLKNKDLAKQFLRAAREEKEKPDLLLDSPNTTEVFNLIIELIIRIFAGLILKNSYNQKDIENIEKIISSLPSERQQLSLWASLILRLILKSKKDDKFPKQLITSYIIPKLSKIRNKNERISAILEVIVVLYFNDKKLLYLEELPSQKLKDIALSKICKFLFTQCLPEDVCDDNNDGYAIDYERAKNILELTNLMRNDYFIYPQIMEIQKSIVSKNTIISSQQKIDIKNEFEKIANFKLPDYNNIKHLGYQILVKANAISIQSKQNWEEWDRILKEVKNIPNLSDQIFMWVSIAELLPQDFSKQKQELINKAVESAYQLPSFLDTVGRIEMIFFALYRKSILGIGLKPLLEKFIEVLNNNTHSPFLRENYRNILDVAYSIDPTSAKTLVNSFDKDVARLNTGAYLNNHLNFLELQSKIEKELEKNKTEQQLLESNPDFFNKIIKKKLSRLNISKKTNDNLLPKDLVYQLKMASEYSIYESYNTFSYFIERLVIKYEDTDEANKLIRRSFLELLDVCNLVKLLSIRNADKIKSLLEAISIEDNNSINELELIKTEISEEKYNTIIDFLSKNITQEQIATISGISVEKIRFIADSLI